MSNDPERLPVTYAAIVFKGGNLDPDLISLIMGVAPTLAYRRGDPYTSNGVASARRFGLWVYSTRNTIESASFGKHLKALEGLMIGPRSEGPDSRHRRLREIKSLVEGGKAELRGDVFWHAGDKAERPRISPSFHEVVAMAGGTVETDFNQENEDIRAA